MTARRKPLPGHKFAGVIFGAATHCECGWRSSDYFGRGAQGQARLEWEIHRDTHAKATGESAQ